MKNLFDLTGKVALVTGGTHGLGLAMAEGLASVGAELVVTSTTPSKLEEAIAYYQSKGYKATGYIFDVTDEKIAAEKVAEIEANHKQIDILINNAGIIKRIPALEMEVSDFRKVIDVDLTGPFIMSQLVAKNMIARRAGKIINICSMMSELGRDNVVAYALSLIHI